MNFIDFLLTHTPFFYLTQSVWRDEAFSIFYASQNFLTILTRSVLEPPLYYLMLHGWMKIFGTSDIAARCFSLVGFTLSIILLIEWASQKYRSKFLQLFVPLLFAINPMILYFAFEVRAYAWYLFFFILSFIAYDKKLWKLFIVASLLAFFTHYYSSVFTLSLVVHYIVTNKKSGESFMKLFRHAFFQSIGIIALIALPQIIRVALQLQTVHASWYYPVDWHLIRSVLGNMLLGYEGTPWYLWPHTAFLSLLLIITMIIPLSMKRMRKTAGAAFIIILLPLFLVIGISFIKPYFVNRYLLPVTFGEILLIAYSVHFIPIRKLKMGVGIGIILLFLAFNAWYPGKHPKTDYRSSLMLANLIQKEHDYIYAQDALNFFETLYYARDRARVRLYNPDNAPFLPYIGDSMFSPSYNATDIPAYPAKAILIKNDGSVGILTIVPPIKSH